MMNTFDIEKKKRKPGGKKRAQEDDLPIVQTPEKKLPIGGNILGIPALHLEREFSFSP